MFITLFGQIDESVAQKADTPLELKGIKTVHLLPQRFLYRLAYLSAVQYPLVRRTRLVIAFTHLTASSLFLNELTLRDEKVAQKTKRIIQLVQQRTVDARTTVRAETAA